MGFKSFFLVFFVSLYLAGSAFAGSYIELYPKTKDSRFFGPINVVTCTTGQTLGTDCGDEFSNWDSVVEIVSGTLTLPPVVKGAWICVKSKSAAAVSIDPYASDRFILDGTALDDGDKITSESGLDDTICFYGDSADGWTTMFNPHNFTDGGI